MQLRKKWAKDFFKRFIYYYYYFKFYFIYFWLHQVFVAVLGLSLVAASGGYCSLRCMGFSLWWLLLLWSTGSRRVGFSSCGSRALEHRLSSCGTRAQLLHGMWDLPRPGLESVSPALAGGFSTTAPPRKPYLLFIYFIYFWLRRVLVAACRIFVEARGIFPCGTRALRCGALASLQLWRVGFLSLVVARAPGCMGSVVCGTWALVEVRELSSCSAWAQLPRGMWDLSSLTGNQTRIPCIARRILHHWTTREIPGQRI